MRLTSSSISGIDRLIGEIRPDLRSEMVQGAGRHEGATHCIAVTPSIDSDAVLPSSRRERVELRVFGC